MKVEVLGAAASQFGRLGHRRLEDIAWDAIGEALEQSGLEPSDIGAVYIGNVFGPTGVAARVARAAGLHDVPVLRLEAACASGTLAAHQAIEAVASHTHRYTLAVGIEQLSASFDGPIQPERSDSEGALGLALPGLYALAARRYQFQYGATDAELAAVAVKNRANGVRNPKAQRQLAVTLDEVLASRPIAEPLTVLQCCPISDGAAAAVFGPARPNTSERVLVEASAVAGGSAWPGPIDELWGVACVRRALNGLRAQTSIPLSDADVFEMHDAFTIGELMTIEALELSPPGKATQLLADGVFHPEGRWPVNVSGGLISRGHALGATGLAQLAEVHAQLTGRAGERQLPNPRLGVVETMGGGASGLDGNAAVVMMLRAG